MTIEGFKQYLNTHFQSTSRAASSYMMAIAILDNIFRLRDVFGLNGVSLCCIDNIEKLIRITDFVKTEERRFRDAEEGIFTLGNPKQKSYPTKGFCSAAMKNLIGYYESCKYEAANIILQSSHSATSLSKKLIKLYDLNDSYGEDAVRETKARIGQDFFRSMLLKNYNSKCAITGLDVPQVLRASHIVAWADDKANRMNPENGILLSATYDAAFDKHLISFDEDYRMIVSKEIKEYYTGEVTKEYFGNLEGKQLILPVKFIPNQELLARHRELLVG